MAYERAAAVCIMVSPSQVDTCKGAPSGKSDSNLEDRESGNALLRELYFQMVGRRQKEAPRRQDLTAKLEFPLLVVS